MQLVAKPSSFIQHLPSAQPVTYFSEIRISNQKIIFRNLASDSMSKSRKCFIMNWYCFSWSCYSYCKITALAIATHMF